MRTVAIAGVGLIGGSFALAIRRAGFTGEIIGVSSPRTIEEALRLKVIDRGASLREAAGAADLVYLAQPISIILSTIPELAGHLKPGALVTDAGSTKRCIAAAAARALPPTAFLGGHPMAGKEARGVAVAEAGLFENRPWILTPVDPAGLERPAVVEFREWLRRIGARVSILSPEEHDLVVAHSSHLPQMLSTALSISLARHPAAPAIAAAAGPGLHDMTRLAMSSWDIWRDIVSTNGDMIAQALRGFSADFAPLADAVENGELGAAFDLAAQFARRARGR
jgi:prephenate dehydrogenase